LIGRIEPAQRFLQLPHIGHAADLSRDQRELLKLRADLGRTYRRIVTRIESTTGVNWFTADAR
jgi:hypothetical protein